MSRVPIRPPRAVAGLALPVLALVTGLAAQAEPRRPSEAPADARHARALQSFQLGRYPEAYGRFVALANAGHPGAARQALWMCEHGPALFGRQWDCGPQQVTDWAAAARDATVQLPAYDEKPARDATAAGRRR